MSPVNVPAIGAYIKEQREQAKISLRQLAQAAGVSNPYLSQIERGLRRPSADILQQIARGLRISAEALYVQAGFLEDRPPGPGVRDAVLADPELTERQKQMLIEVYESFRKETAAALRERTVLLGDLAAEGSGSGTGASQDSAPQDSAPQDSASQDSASQDSASRDSASQDSAPQDSAPQDSASQNGASESSGPGAGVSEDSGPGAGVSEDSEPAGAEPGEAELADDPSGWFAQDEAPREPDSAPDMGRNRVA